MAYQFADTFDHYTDATMMYESVVGTAPSFSTAYARFPQIGSYPNKGVLLAAGSTRIRKNLKSNCVSVIGFMSYGGPLPASNNFAVMSFWDNGTLQCYLGVTSTGALVLAKTATTVLATSALGIISASTLPTYGIEVYVKFHGSTGEVTVNLNGQTVISHTTGLNTITTANAYASQVPLGNVTGVGTNVYTDYICIWDLTGSYQCAMRNLDARKLTKLPTGAGASANFIPSAGANYACCNDNPPNDDTNYVSSSTGTNEDSYAMGSAGLGTTPSMVVSKSRVRKDDAFTRGIQVGAKTALGTNSLGSAVNVSTSYVFYDACLSLNPDTGLPFTDTEADALLHCKVG
jgi:hypothetical protein